MDYPVSVGTGREDMHMKEHAQAGDIEGLTHEENMGMEGHTRKDIHKKGHTHEETYTRSDICME